MSNFNKNDCVILQNVNSERDNVYLSNINNDVDGSLVKFIRYEGYHYHKALGINVPMCRVTGIKVSRSEMDGIFDISELLLPETCLKLIKNKLL